LLRMPDRPRFARLRVQLSEPSAPALGARWVPSCVAPVTATASRPRVLVSKFPSRRRPARQSARASPSLRARALSVTFVNFGVPSSSLALALASRRPPPSPRPRVSVQEFDSPPSRISGHARQAACEAPGRAIASGVRGKRGCAGGLRYRGSTRSKSATSPLSSGIEVS